MARGSSPPGYRSSELVRLLARMAELDAPGAEPPFVEALGRWLHWTDAIALAGAISAQAPDAASAAGPDAGSQARREFDRVRQTLVRTIDDDAELAGETDFAAWRRLYLERQQTMDRAITALRAGLRAALSRREPRIARLAAVDAALGDALAPREKAVLGAIPAMLASRFERLHASSDASPGSTVTSLDALRAEMRSVLHAELELRLQPARGLLEALLSTGEPVPIPT